MTESGHGCDTEYSHRLKDSPITKEISKMNIPTRELLSLTKVSLMLSQRSLRA